MAPPRMTANPKRPSRYRPGKGHDQSSDSESELDGEQTEQKSRPKPKSKPQQVTSTVRGAFQEVTLSGIKASGTSAKAQDINEDEFETESEEEENAGVKKPSAGIAQRQDDASQESSEEEEGSSEEEADTSESSSEEEAAPKLLRPTFIPKNQRASAAATNIPAQSESQVAAESEARRKEKADALVQAQLERNAQLKANEKKAWDDSDNEGAEGKTEAEIDDTDDLDPEAERAAWKLRELKRIKRSREQIEEAEREREEIERRRNLSKEEREAEDAAHIAAQEEDREGRGKAGYMQRYFHKGAFFQDSAYAEEAGLKGRDIMGSRFADQVSNREVLPEFMQIRDMAKLGRKGRTKYKDLKSEDTGRWGDYGRYDNNRYQQGDATRTNGKIDDTLDERFRPDDFGRGRAGPSGANTTAVNPSKRRDRSPPPKNAPTGPSDYARNSDRRRSYSRSRSPPSRNDRRHSRERYRSRSRQKDRRKRSASPDEYRAKHRDNADMRGSNSDKRVRVD